MTYQDSFQDVTVISVKTTKEAIGIIAYLCSFDQRFCDQPYSAVINEIYGSVMHGFYTIAAREVPQPQGDPLIQPLAVLCWAQLSPATAVIKANNIRQLSPVEYRSGAKSFFTLFSSPFEQPDQMIKLMRAKDQKLQAMDNVTFVDKLFKPEYNQTTLKL